MSLYVMSLLLKGFPYFFRPDVHILTLSVFTVVHRIWWQDRFQVSMECPQKVVASYHSPIRHESKLYSGAVVIRKGSSHVLMTHK